MFRIRRTEVTHGSPFLGPIMLFTFGGFVQSVSSAWNAIISSQREAIHLLDSLSIYFPATLRTPLEE